jgi:hypothetical protein
MDVLPKIEGEGRVFRGQRPAFRRFLKDEKGFEKTSLSFFRRLRGMLRDVGAGVLQVSLSPFGDINLEWHFTRLAKTCKQL